MYNPDYAVVSEEHDRLIEEINDLKAELAATEKSANYWYSVALGQKAPRAIEVEKAEAELEGCRSHEEQLVGVLEELQAAAIVLRVECDEYIAYIGTLEEFVSQYKPGPMLTDQRPECLKDVLPHPTRSGEW